MTKNEPTRRQKVALRSKRERAQIFRAWRNALSATTERARAKLTKGPDRVADAPRPIEYVHRQPDPIEVAPGIFAPSRPGTTYRNPARVAKLAKSGRLRKELQS